MPITSIDQIQDLMCQGQGASVTIASAATSAQTAAGAAGGGLNPTYFPEAIGTTLWSTIVQPKLPAGDHRLVSAQLGSTRGLTHMLGFLHQLGTVALGSGTGNKFTPDASLTMPLTRNEFGVSNAKVVMTPFLLITTATTVTAPILTIDYDDQDGNATTGTKSITFPAAATALGTTLVPFLEDGDSGITDINAVNVSTAASAGAATLYGWEPLELLSNPAAGLPVASSFMRGYQMAPLTKPTPASGTLTSLFGIVGIGSASATTIRGYVRGVSNA